jgi:pyridine nucleotide-disulfide oxidoreductase family protein
MKRLLLVGAGHAHAQVLLELAAAPPAHGIDVTLVSPAPLAPYSGMVPGWMAGHYRWDQCCIDFAALCRSAGAVFRVDSAIGLDPASSRLRLAGGEQLAYEVLSLDIGSTSNPPAIGLAQVLPMRPLSRLRERWDALREAVRALPPGATHRIVVVGGGAAGVESLLATRRQLARWAPHVAFDYVLATQGAGLLPALAPSAANKLAAHFEAHGIALVQNFEAAQFDAGAVVSRDGRRLPADVVLWAAGAVAHAWPNGSGIAQDSAGFIQVDSTLRSLSHPNIFASGDCASLPTAVPKAGVFAVRMGPVLAHNLRAALDGRHLQTFAPQKRNLVLLGTGGEHAVAAWGPLSWQGHWVWRWKRRIDLRFLRKYNGAPKQQ